MTLGEYLKDVRVRKKMTLRDIEEKCDVSNAYVSQIENGTRQRPHPDILSKLAKGLEIDKTIFMKLAGYIEDNIISAEDEALNRAFEFVKSDKRFIHGTRVDRDMSTDSKRFIIEMYEKATGLKLLAGENNSEPNKEGDV